jgi:glycyl-tRNA synthetase
MMFHPKVAPYKVAVFPLMKKSELAGPAEAIYRDLRKTFRADYDDAGSIGKRYRRQEEIGTPFCVTVDFDTLQDQSVTVRHRDTMAQERVSISSLETYLKEGLETWKP